LLALEKGDIDLIADFIDAAQIPRLQQNPNIAIGKTDRRGFGHLSFNTAKFPGNITEFRQAAAYALDKNRISTEAWGGFSRPIDSPVPPSMGVWSYEDQFPEHYYDSNIAKAQELLESAGFVDTTGDGVREYMGQPFQLQVFGSAGNNVVETVLVVFKENMRQAGINVATRFVDFNTLLNRLDSGDFNLAFFGFSLGLDPDHLIDFFKCDAEFNAGIWRYCNPGLDAVLEQMQAAETFEEAVAAAWEAQKILWVEQPMILAYMNLLISAYRTDRFEGYLNVPGDGVATGWTYIKVKPTGGVSGGEFKVSIPEPVQSQNVLSTNSAYSIEVMGQIYDGVGGIGRNPFTLAYMSYFAKSWQVQKAADGGLELTIQYYEGITWHDGMPFTAEDVKFSYELQQAVEAPYVIDAIRNVDSVEVVDPLTVKIHSTESGYFEFSRMQGAWLLPKHIWGEIPSEQVLSYRNDKPVGTGPFMFERAAPGEFYVVAWYEKGLWVPKERGGNPPTPVVLPPTTTTAPPPPPPPPPPATTPIATGPVTTPAAPAPGLPSNLLLIAAVVIIIVLIAGYAYTRRKKPSPEMGTSTS
jgi:ABC-type transport system substrate-binding protein